jgi:predicted nucleic acid-binding protein
VLVQARETKLVSALKPLDALIADGFRIAPALVRDALAAVGEDE